MRAISDPLHQQVVDQFGRHKNPVIMLSYVGRQSSVTPLEVIKHNRSNWSPSVTWQSHFGALRLMIDGAVQIFATKEMEPIHYSVFGESGVLLQSKHEHTVEQKFVWLIEDVLLNRFLRDQAERSEKGAKLIPANQFREVLSSICSIPALDYLTGIRTGSVTKPHHRLDRPLSAIGFISRRAGKVTLTKAGNSYLACCEMRATS